jgi:organic hydroperoxide reductase OsmC/OhrA
MGRTGRTRPCEHVVVAVKPKELRYAIDLDGASLRTEDGTPLDAPAEWTPEHLLLAALTRCSLASLGFHAVRAGLRLSNERGSANAVVTRREEDGRYAVVEATLSLDVELEPQPGPDELAELLGKAERDCFVGASLRVGPSYRWVVNGAQL